MIKNVLHFALYNFLALVALILLAHGMIFVGSISSSIFAATALNYRISKQDKKLSTTQLALTGVICAAVTTVIGLSFEFLFYQQESDVPFLTLVFVAFFISLIFILLILKSVYITNEQAEAEMPINKSPIIKKLTVYCSKLSSLKYSQMSDQELIKNASHIQSFVGITVVIIAILSCGVAWVFLNKNLLDYPLLIIGVLAMLIILLQFFAISRKLIEQELKVRFLKE
ncbi:hypothetical protein L1D29_12240 [Shewanella insulae]|uniref:hypothetical protein n=1 Tax=Shewanella insulae TaxID=2681496 RepID=UPI001EFC42AA|nr:hypothetical protein [Shewanella insulae]MCG9713585.1 hypothetical protein [Shewanella insulae]